MHSLLSVSEKAPPVVHRTPEHLARQENLPRRAFSLCGHRRKPTGTEHGSTPRRQRQDHLPTAENQCIYTPIGLPEKEFPVMCCCFLTGVQRGDAVFLFLGGGSARASAATMDGSRAPINLPKSPPGNPLTKSGRRSWSCFWLRRPRWGRSVAPAVLRVPDRWG